VDFKKDIAELQNEVRSVMLLALDYRGQLKKLIPIWRRICRLLQRRRYMRAYLGIGSN